MAPQIPRVALVFGVLVIAFFVARSQTVPDTFGDKGHYRAAFPAELASLPLIHSGKQACMECHSDKPETTPHFKIGVSCESCHGPAQKHVENFDEFKPFVPNTRAACGRCHEAIVGRSPSFPQQNLKEHNPGQRCISCHEIHSEGEPK